MLREIIVTCAEFIISLDILKGSVDMNLNKLEKSVMRVLVFEV